MNSIPRILLTVLLLIPFAAINLSGSELPVIQVTSQGLLGSAGDAALHRSAPGGRYAMEIEPVGGGNPFVEVSLHVTPVDGAAHRLDGLRGNEFLIADTGCVVVIETPDTNRVPSRLSIVDLDGKLLTEYTVDVLTDPSLSTDGLRLVWRDLEGVALLDLTTLEMTRYPNCTLFTAGPRGLFAGVFAEGEKHIRVYSAAGLIHQSELPSVPRRMAFSADGSSLFVLTGESLSRLDLLGLSVDSPSLLTTVYTSPDDAELRDLRPVGDEILVGLRRQRSGLTEGTMVRLDAGGRILGLEQGPTVPIGHHQDFQQDAASMTPSLDDNSHDAVQPRAGSSGSRAIPWPLFPDSQHEVGNTYGEYQNYGSSYLHPGVDAMGDPGQPVYAVAGGVVKAVITTSGEWHWRVAVGDTGGSGTVEGYLYAHLEETSIAVSVGQTVTQGQYLGDLVGWPIYDFTHIHFARIEDSGTQWYGSWLNTSNPHLEFSNQTEGVAPVFENAVGGDLFAFSNNESSTYQDPDSLTGEVDIIAHVGDTIAGSWVCAVQEIRYSIYPVGAPGSPVVDDRQAVYFDMVLDTYSSGSIDAFLVGLFYKQDGTCYTQGDYDYREFYHIITNSDGDLVYNSADQQEAWDTSLVPDGQYVVEVTAYDVAGNSTTETMTVSTSNGNLETLDASLSCLPSSGTLPFQTVMTVTLSNLYTGQTRRFAGHLDVDLAGGQHFSNWRAGWTNVDAAGAYTSYWSQSIPALGNLVGSNVFSLVAQDVTPVPYNQPPHPPAGDTDSAACTIVGISP